MLDRPTPKIRTNINITVPSARITGMGAFVGRWPRHRTIKRTSLNKQAYRARLRDGGRVPRIPLSDYHGSVELLLDLGWLTESHSRNGRLVAVATGRLLDDLVAWANAMREKFGPQWTDHVDFPRSNSGHEH